MPALYALLDMPCRFVVLAFSVSLAMPLPFAFVSSLPPRQRHDAACFSPMPFTPTSVYVTFFETPPIRRLIFTLRLCHYRAATIAAIRHTSVMPDIDCCFRAACRHYSPPLPSRVRPMRYAEPPYALNAMMMMLPAMAPCRRCYHAFLRRMIPAFLTPILIRLPDAADAAAVDISPPLMVCQLL